MKEKRSNIKKNKVHKLDVFKTDILDPSCRKQVEIKISYRILVSRKPLMVDGDGLVWCLDII